MKVIIVAAGRGTRMGAVTEAIPKCLIPFSGRPLIDWQIQALAAAGLDDVVIVTGYKAAMLEGYGRQRVHNPRWAETNMVYSLNCARHAFLHGGPVLVAYADLLYEPRVIDAVINAEDDVATAVDRSWSALWRARMGDPMLDAESLRIGERNAIVEIGRAATKLGEIDGRYVGLTKFTAAGARRFVVLYDAMTAGEPWLDGRSPERCYFTDMLQGLILGGVPVRAALVEGGWLEVDTDTDLALYERFRAEGSLGRFISLGWMKAA